MNIFFLHRDAKLAAKYHVDRHVCKMLIEYAQLLSTALRLNGVTDERLYRITHKNHPCAIWTRESVLHFAWLVELMIYLSNEYTIRYGKEHKSAALIDVFFEHFNALPTNDFIWNDPQQCMPDDCKCEDTIQAYRNYYMKHKRHIAYWKTEVPEWFV